MKLEREQPQGQDPIAYGEMREARRMLGMYRLLEAVQAQEADAWSLRQERLLRFEMPERMPVQATAR
ncbi:MAG: hypothetical protein H6648_06905 [Caldilineae bacterium]|nr:hypothetical protein [Chloroflexota bacterium]MCB9176875.1 hypothetical protein [Caldilineae bacterium]